MVCFIEIRNHCLFIFLVLHEGSNRSVLRRIKGERNQYIFCSCRVFCKPVGPCSLIYWVWANECGGVNPLTQLFSCFYGFCPERLWFKGRLPREPVTTSWILSEADLMVAGREGKRSSPKGELSLLWGVLWHKFCSLFMERICTPELERCNSLVSDLDLLFQHLLLCWGRILFSDH